MEDFPPRAVFLSKDRRHSPGRSGEKAKNASFRIRRAMGLAALLAAASFACLLPRVSQGQTKAHIDRSAKFHFDLPPQPLAWSLRDYARICGRQIIFTEALVGNHTAPSLHGAYTPADALAVLLKDTNLVPDKTASGIEMIRLREDYMLHDQKFPLLAKMTLGVAVLATTPSPAFAQTASKPKVGMEEIVVTARRRSEDPQKVPIALSVFGGTKLERQNIFTLDQLQRQAPSLQVVPTNAKNVNINIRGLGGAIGQIADGMENGVGVYIDDVYYARPGQATFDLVDMERIELLRGPQGTLFGKNTTSGALSMYTREPDFQTDLRGDASYGSYGNRQLHGAIGGALIADKVAARLSAGWTANNGYLRNLVTGKRVNNYNNYTVRGQILALLSDNLKLRLIGDFASQHDDALAFTNVDLVTTRTIGGVESSIPNGIAARVARAGISFPIIDPFSRNVEWDITPHLTMNQGGASAKFDWDVADHTITAISAYRSWNFYPRNEGDGTKLPILTNAQADTQQRQFTQEIRIASNNDKNINYVVGAFYFHQKIDSQFITSYGSAAPIWVLGADTPLNQAILNGFAVNGTSTIKTDSYAAFGQMTWKIDSKWSMTLGLRYTGEKKNGAFNQVTSGADLSGFSAAQQATALATRAAFGGPNAYEASTKENKISGQANISYQFSDGILGYATYGRGFKSGGLTLSNVSPTTPKVIEPELIENYELGLKTQNPDGSLTFNLAGFWTIDKNYQATIFDAVRSTVYVSNVGKVRSRGIEAEANWRPVDDLTTYASLTYLDAKYLSFTNAPCPIEQLGVPACDVSGRTIAGAPKWTVAVGGEYNHAISETVTGYIGLDYSYRASSFFLTNLSPSSKIPAYSLVNARVGARIGDSFDVSVWARNLFDKNYFIARQPAAFNTGVIAGNIGDPRVIGVTGRFHF